MRQERLMGVVKKASQRAHHGLLLMFILNRLAKTGLEIYPYYLMQAGLCNENGSELRRKLDPGTPDLLELSDVRAISSIPGYHVSEKRALEWLANGCRCFGVKRDAEIASLVWCNLRECRSRTLSFPLGEDEAYLFDSYTAEAFRGKNLAPYLRYQMYKHLASMGRTKCYSSIHLFNTPSLKVARKVNARPLRLYLYINLFNQCHCRFVLKDYETRMHSLNV